MTTPVPDLYLFARRCVGRAGAHRTRHPAARPQMDDGARRAFPVGARAGSAAAGTYQDQIDRLCRPSDADVVVCLLWCRFGTRLPASVHPPGRNSILPRYRNRARGRSRGLRAHREPPGPPALQEDRQAPRRYRGCALYQPQAPERPDLRDVPACIDRESRWDAAARDPSIRSGRGISKYCWNATSERCWRPAPRRDGCAADVAASWRK